MQAKYDLREGFPLLTTKKVLFSAVVRELLWFLRGSTNINDDLTEHTPIWDAWAKEDGELGPIYGYQGANGQSMLKSRMGYTSASTSTRFKIYLTKSKTIRIAAGSLSTPGTLPIWTKWRFLPVICSFSSMSSTADSTASSINAQPIWLWVCLST